MLLRSPISTALRGLFPFIRAGPKAGIHPVYCMISQWQQSILCRVSPKSRKDSTKLNGHLFRSFGNKKPFEKRALGFLHSFIIYPRSWEILCPSEKMNSVVVHRISCNRPCFLPLVQVQRQTHYSCSPWLSPPSWSSTPHRFCEQWIWYAACQACHRRASLIPPIAFYSYARHGSQRAENQQLPDRQCTKNPRTLSGFSFYFQAVKNRRTSSVDLGGLRLLRQGAFKGAINRYRAISLNNNPTDRKELELINRQSF